MIRKIVVVADGIVLAVLALVLMRPNQWGMRVLDTWMFFVLPGLLFINFFCLLGLTSAQSRPRHLFRLWLDAKEKELKGRADH